MLERSRRRLLSIPIGVLLAATVGYYVTSYMPCRAIVQGRSMLPTLKDGDRRFFNRLAYLSREPRREEVVVIRDPHCAGYVVKRIIAGPGESLLISGGDVYLNGVKLHELYLLSETKTMLPKLEGKLIVLGQDQYYVLGDNRSHSEDSRYYGPVHRKQIMGRLVR